MLHVRTDAVKITAIFWSTNCCISEKMNDTFRAMLWLMDYKLYVMYRIKSFRLTLGDLQNHFTYWKWKPLQSRHANVLIKSTDNRTRGHDFKFIKQTCSVDATKYYFTNRVVMSVTHYHPITNTVNLQVSVRKTWFLVLFVTVYCLACGFYMVFLFQVFNFFFQLLVLFCSISLYYAVLLLWQC